MENVSITIDEEALAALQGIRRSGETFSATILRVLGTRRNPDVWWKELEENPLSEETVAALDEMLAQRRGPDVEPEPADLPRKASA
jgi:predicted CopG family antitoxin